MRAKANRPAPAAPGPAPDAEVEGEPAADVDELISGYRIDRGANRANQIRLIVHLARHAARLLSDELLLHLGFDRETAAITAGRASDAELARRVDEFLGIVARPERPPIKFALLDYKTYVSYLDGLRTRAGGQLSLSSRRTHRSALTNLYEDYGAERPEQLRTKIKQYFKKIGRDAVASAEPERALRMSGKKPISMELYADFMREMLACGTREPLFLRAASITQMNLMSRSDNSLGITFNDIAWRQDCFGLRFMHSKTDSQGSCCDLYRHCYANPYKPDTCFSLALALYVMVEEKQGELPSPRLARARPTPA
jgi:hypothetical protein